MCDVRAFSLQSELEPDVQGLFKALQGLRVSLDRDHQGSPPADERDRGSGEDHTLVGPGARQAGHRGEDRVSSPAEGFPNRRHHPLHRRPAEVEIADEAARARQQQSPLTSAAGRGQQEGPQQQLCE